MKGITLKGLIRGLIFSPIILFDFLLCVPFKTFYYMSKGLEFDEAEKESFNLIQKLIDWK